MSSAETRQERGTGLSSVCVVGAGYVGLPTAACLSHLGHDVVCSDVDAAKIERLQRGQVDLLDQGLEPLVRAGSRNGRLHFAVETVEHVAAAEFVIVCLPTLCGPGTATNLSVIEDVAREIAPRLRADAVVVAKSTLPVGSTAWLTKILRDSGAAPGVAVACNPEFLREGMAVHEFLHPHRVVIGADDDATAARVESLYRGIDAPVVITDTLSAEMIKYASNAFLATKISFANELANACEVLGADVTEVVRGMGHDPRVGFECLAPGPGWGGSCLPKDTVGLLQESAAAGYEFGLLRRAVEVNELQRVRIVDMVSAAHDAPLEATPVAVWGLAFKAGTDDVRSSAAVDVVRMLLARGATVRAFDPAVDASVTGLPIDGAADPYDACDAANVLVVLTEWEEFRSVDLARVAGRMARRRIVDARNVLDPARARVAGFDYWGIGRPTWQR